MKKIIYKIFLLSAGLFLLLNQGAAQKTGSEKTDKITFLNGTTRDGKVLAFLDERICFVHTGETLNYEFPKKEIEKIEYASGRVEVITEKKAPGILPAPVVSKNRVAVIPLQYTGYGNEGRKEDMGFFLQEIAINYLSKSATELQLVDATEINAALLKNGISDSSIRKYTASELAAILHVEYIIIGSVLQDNSAIVTNATGNKVKKQDDWGNGDYKRRENYQQSVVLSQHVETQVTLSIYNEMGEKIYSKSRHSLLAERDAYKNTIHYILKRTPLYKR
jgi:hypothetical protein